MIGIRIQEELLKDFVMSINVAHLFSLLVVISTTLAKNILLEDMEEESDSISVNLFCIGGLDVTYYHPPLFIPSGGGGGVIFLGM